MSNVAVRYDVSLLFFHSHPLWRPLRARASRIARCFTAAAVSLLVVAGWAPVAGAHTGFQSSDPADGATLDAPVEAVTLRFSGAAEPAGEGFVVLDPVLGSRKPTSVTRAAEGVFELGFDPAIAGGEVGVRWSVRAPDAHPIDGSFRFTVTAAAPALGDPSTDGPTPPPAESLDDFLVGKRTSPAGELLADASRFLSMGATLIAAGFLVFCLTVMRGARRELRLLLYWVRRAGLVIVVGTAGDAVGQVVDQAGGFDALVDPGAYWSVLGGSLGLSLGVRLAGGAIITACTRLVVVHAGQARDVVRSISTRVPIGAGTVRVADRPEGGARERDLAWELDRRGAFALLGFALVLVSHVMDGHTVTEGNRWMTGAVSSLHVLAAAVWGGGVAALALVIRDRWRRGEPTHALMMVVRYSVVATIALGAVAVAGVYLAVVILDAPSELWSTAWGRIFLAKFAVVAVAAAFGAHNHHVIVPALEISEEHPDAVGRLRATLAKEVVALTAVTLLTALLVRAASTI